jgi:hypothetical protein
MGDLAGVYDAIKARIEANWTTTDIGYFNEDPPQSEDSSGAPIPWVLVEFSNTSDGRRGAGTPGQNIWLAEGSVQIHIFVPTGSGASLAYSYAVTLADIFRGASFYTVTPGEVVRTDGARIGGGDSGSDDGKWFRVTVVVEWRYFYRS